jgi:hypothetical protein
MKRCMQHALEIDAGVLPIRMGALPSRTGTARNTDKRSASPG